MAQPLTRGIPQTVSDFDTTMTELTWEGGIRPDVVSVQATTEDAYVAFGANLDGQARPTHYWPIPAGTTQSLDIRNITVPMAISVAGASDVHVWPL